MSMFTLFQAGEKEMNTLDEKQIQERLYGKYHKGSSSPSTRPSSEVKKPGFSAAPPPPKIEKITQSPVSGRSGILDSLAIVLSHVPWKFVGVLAGAFVVTLLLVNMVVFLLGKAKFDGGQSAEYVNNPKMSVTEKSFPARTESEPVRSVSPTQRVKLSENINTSAKPDRRDASSSAVSGASAPIAAKPNEKIIKQKFYGVQVCTYQRQGDAESLVSELNQRGFRAFFKETPSQQKVFFVVYLNRSRSYAEAQSFLSEFKQTDLYSQFRDAYIVSI